MTRATLDALHRSFLQWIAAQAAESIKNGRTRWEVGDDILAPIEHAVAAIKRARTHSEAMMEAPSAMAHRMVSNVNVAFSRHGVESAPLPGGQDE